MPTPLEIEPANPGFPAEATKVFVRPTGLKSFYILKRDLEKHGFTPGWPACELIRGGGARKGGVVHSDVCRTRVEGALAADPDDRHRVEKYLGREATQPGGEDERAPKRKAGSEPGGGRASEEPAATRTKVPEATPYQQGGSSG